ncbi:hypothetical protein KR038_003580 [Drosophila bunnanda]|nr:hypothetical protein KR038_003580 [Drosophila bunnanda]
MKVSGSWKLLILLVILCCQLFPVSEASSVVITNENLGNILKSNDLVLLSFYADWCYFSKLLEPIFEEAAAKVREKFSEDGRVILGRVNCAAEKEIAQAFNIVKYPTLKVAKSGVIYNNEYRGQRSVKGFVEFVERELTDPIKEFHNISELNNELEDGLVIGCFASRDDEEYLRYRKAARVLRDHCKFMVGFGEVSKDLHHPGKNLLIFRADTSTINHTEYYSEYSGNMPGFTELLHWMSEHCMPLVREITFENAEEITEEGLPLLLAFYDKNDLGPVQEFKAVVQSQLVNETRINILTADGALFAHPLAHMGKSRADLPLIAIDSFQHMYVFPKFADIHKPGALKKFIDDLFSGQLHVDYHMIIDLEEEQNTMSDAEDVTQPVVHESKFKELLPSKHRYTLLNPTRDEL